MQPGARHTSAAPISTSRWAASEPSWNRWTMWSGLQVMFSTVAATCHGPASRRRIRRGPSGKALINGE
jgi:hypothetical protein